jgi:DNA-binding response OmpR family regulator
MTDTRQRVLVVDDDPALAAGLGELLSQEGYRVSIVHEGRAAIEKASGRPPDLVILDVQLPDRSGFEVLRQLRAAGFRRKILMLSSLRDEVHKVVGLDAGANDFITKPFAPQELVARVRSHLRDQQADVGGSATGSRGQRRLLRAIVFMDMEGYSRRVSRNEALGLSLLGILRRTLVRTIRRHNGSIIDSPGDAFMASFESALQAVECGLDVHRRLERRNRSVPTVERIRVRVGVHFGDVLEIGDALRGNTVNIASRLEEIGRPGSLTVSEEVLHAVEGRLACTVRRVGVRRFKNIHQSKTVYRILPSPSPAQR